MQFAPCLRVINMQIQLEYSHTVGYLRIEPLHLTYKEKNRIWLTVYWKLNTHDINNVLKFRE